MHKVYHDLQLSDFLILKTCANAEALKPLPWPDILTEKSSRFLENDGVIGF